MKPLPVHVTENASYFRDDLRAARQRAIDDAEDYASLLHAFERLGSALLGRIEDLGHYEGRLNSLAGRSALARTVPQRHSDCHVCATDLFRTIREGRNDAMHQGAFACQLASAAIQYALVLEDALMSGEKQVGNFMVREPITAQLWEPISFIRQQMLAHSFSYLPVRLANGTGWWLVSDLNVATYLRKPHVARRDRLAKRLEEVISTDTSSDDTLNLVGPVPCVGAKTPIDEVLTLMDNGARMVLVFHGAYDSSAETKQGGESAAVIATSEHVVGLIMPFDLL